MTKENPMKANRDSHSSNSKENLMRQIKIEKVVLSVGGIGDELEKGVKLLAFLTKRKPAKMKSSKRIPSFSVRPGLEVGAVVTLRKDFSELLKRIFVTLENTLKRKQVSENNFSLGIKEYIEIPGIEYQREIGVRGFDITVVFKRTGRRVKLKKIKRAKVSSRQKITREEIIKFMEENFKMRFI